jgi:hypothetical protein
MAFHTLNHGFHLFSKKFRNVSNSVVSSGSHFRPYGEVEKLSVARFQVLTALLLQGPQNTKQEFQSLVCHSGYLTTLYLLKVLLRELGAVY